MAKNESEEGKIREKKKDYNKIKDAGRDDYDSPGSPLSQHRVMLIMAIVLSVILLAVFILRSVGVITQFVANCIYFPLLAIVIIIYLIGRQNHG